MNDAGALLLASDKEMQLGDAAAAILTLPDGRYVLQERDRHPAVWYPGHWGLFGGAIDDPSETAEAALRRELQEELEFTPVRCDFFIRTSYDYAASGTPKAFARSYFVVPITEQELAGLTLHEGRSMGVFAPDEVFSRLELAPYDGFVLFLHAGRGRIRLPGHEPV